MTNLEGLPRTQSTEAPPETSPCSHLCFPGLDDLGVDGNWAADPAAADTFLAFCGVSNFRFFFEPSCGPGVDAARFTALPRSPFVGVC